MSRKVVIVALTLAALATALLWVVTHQRVLAAESPLSDKAHVGILIADGLAGCLVCRDKPQPNPYISCLGSSSFCQGTVASLDVDYPWSHNPDWVRPLFDQGIFGRRYRRIELRYATITVAVAPLWSLTALFATYPTIAFIGGPVRRWRRRRNGWCVECGYDLTGNVSGICPECGTPITGLPRAPSGLLVHGKVRT